MEIAMVNYDMSLTKDSHLLFCSQENVQDAKPIFQCSEMQCLYYLSDRVAGKSVQNHLICHYNLVGNVRRAPWE